MKSNRVRRLLQPVRALGRYLRLPAAAKAEHRKDALGLPTYDPGIERAIDEGIAWLGRAQDHSTSADGRVARHYSLETGWNTSYPETTGYVIPTVLSYARLRGNETARPKNVGFPRGEPAPRRGISGGVIGAKHVVPVTFNTGQILLGLASGVSEFDVYREAMRRAADWLLQTQDPDSCWRKHPTSFAVPRSGFITHDPLSLGSRNPAVWMPPSRSDDDEPTRLGPDR